RWLSFTNARLATAFYYLNPFVAAYNPVLICTSFGVVLFTAWFVSLCNGMKRPVLSGLLGGATSLAIPALLPAMLLGYIFAFSFNRRGVLLATALMLFSLAPWMVRNASVGGRPTPFPLAVSGRTIWYGMGIDETPPLVFEGLDDYNV